MSSGEPTRFGPYAVESELGRGGMGVVYRARHADTGDLVALKVLGDAGGAEAAARFQREVRLAAELDHPGIVRCVASGTTDGHAWFAMELIDGLPLDRAISELEFSWQRAVEIARDAAAALGAAHSHGVLHRDLKPSNILMQTMTGTGQAPACPRARIADFGLAKDTRTGSKYTHTGQTLGTPAYMSPEQARGELADLTPASDVWSLGCVLYEMLAGRPAFAGDTPAGVVGQVLTASPASLRAGLPGLPRPVIELVMGALDRDPARRPADGAAYAAECERVLAGGRPVHRGPRARRGPWLSAAAVVVAIAAGAAVWWRPAAGPAPEPPPSDEASRLAEQALQLGVADPRAGADLLRQALALRPAETSWRVQLGRLEWIAGNGAAARDVWDTIGAPDAAHARAQLYCGLSHLFHWRPEGGFTTREGVEMLRPLVDEEGEVGRLARAAVAMAEHRPAQVQAELRADGGWEAQLILGLTFQRLQRTEDARRCFDSALAQGVRFDWVRINRAAARTAQGDPEGAAQELEAILRDLPDSLYARLAYADALTHLGRNDAALAVYNEVIEWSPGTAKARVNRGKILMERGDHAGALADFEAALALTPHDSRALANRGILLSMAGRPAEALADLERAAELEPTSADVFANLGVVYRTLQRWSEAETAYTQAIQLGGERAELYVNRAGARSARGDVAGAFEDLGTAATIAPNSPLPHVMRAHVLAAEGRLPEADAAAARALELHPGFADALAIRARLHYAQRRFPPAYRDYAELVRQQPKRPDHALWAGHAASAAGMHREAVAALEHYLRLVSAGADADNARKMLTHHRAKLR